MSGMSSAFVFVEALTCKDGRGVAPLASYVRAKWGANAVPDMDTEPGIDKILAEKSDEALTALWDKVEISLQKHGASTILVIGHHECAANPVDDATHHEHVRAAVEKVRAHAFSKPVEVIGLFVNGQWAIEEVPAVSQKTVATEATLAR
jgi:hypothetical protein